MTDDESKIEIQRATVEQTALVHQFLQPFISRDQLLTRTEADIQNLITKGFIATLDQKIVGFAAVEVYSRKMAELQCLAVDPSIQGQGIGQRLVELCVEQAKSEGVLELMAITANEKIFRRCGFDYSLPMQKRALFISTSPRD